MNDTNILYNELDNINPIIKKNIKYLCADKGYCSNKNIIKLLNSNIIPIIPFNKRNTKDKTKTKCLTGDEKNILRKRIYIEHLFVSLKSFIKIAIRYEKYIDNLRVNLCLFNIYVI